MDKRLCAAAVQFNIALGDVDRNLSKAVAGIERAAKQNVQLAVLPEMWSAGYDYKRLSKHAEETPRVLDAISARSAQLGMVVVGSLPEKADGLIYNTAYVIDRGELLDRYRKLHMFSTMGEDRFLSPGDRTLVVSTSVGRLGVAICYDLLPRAVSQDGPGRSRDYLSAGRVAQTPPGALADFAAGQSDGEPTVCCGRELLRHPGQARFLWYEPAVVSAWRGARRGRRYRRRAGRNFRLSGDAGLPRTDSLLR